MREVAGRMLATYLDLAEEAGLRVEELVAGLALDTSDLEERSDFDTVALLLERICVAIGGEQALVDAFARCERAVPDLVAVAHTFTTPLELARFIGTKVMPANFTCLFFELEAQDALRYTLRVRLHPGYRESRAVLLATVALLRGQPRLQGLAEANVRWEGDPRDFTCHVDLPEPSGDEVSPPSLSSVDRRRAGGFLGALLADRTHYRRDSLYLGRAFTRLGRDAYSGSDSAAFATAIVRALTSDLGHGFAAVWCDQGGDSRLLASAGLRGEQHMSIPLLIGGARIGVVETDTKDGRETLTPLLSLAALGLVRRLEREQSPTLREVFPEAWRLTKRQREVAALVCEGASNPSIASSLGCSTGTVEEHLTAVYAKAGVDSRQLLAATVLAFRRNLRG